MQLAHLLPHLDAEIERLQKARDILALSSSSTGTLSAFDQELAMRERSLQSNLAPAKTAKKQVNKLAATNSVVSAPEADIAKISAAAIRTRIKTRHAGGTLRSESRIGRRKRLTSPDTALRGLVPSGPVVVSAEEVRKSQASKTAQTTRAAEVRQAGAETVSTFNWRRQTSDGRSVDLLLQRLMSIGEGTEQGRDRQLPSLGQRESPEVAVHASSGSKLD